MRGVHVWLVGGAALVLACDNPDSATIGVAEPGFALVADGNVGAKGEGQSQLPTGFGVADFSFDAKETGHGPEGTFRMFRIRNGLTSDFEGRVICVSVDRENHRAWIGGIVTANNSTDPNQRLAIHQVGEHIWFRVVDYGNPSGNDPDVADRITVMGFKGAGGVDTSPQYCALRPWLSGDANTFPLIGGDLKVRPD